MSNHINERICYLFEQMNGTDIMCYGLNVFCICKSEEYKFSITKNHLGDRYDLIIDNTYRLISFDLNVIINELAKKAGSPSYIIPFNYEANYYNNLPNLS